MRGDVWDVRIRSLGGATWVGPYDQLQRHIAKQGYGGQLEAAHIVGGEHLSDIGAAVHYDKAPCVAVHTSFHKAWTWSTTKLQTDHYGGRSSAQVGRTVLNTNDVSGLYKELYSAFPELQDMSGRIINSTASTGEANTAVSGRPARGAQSAALPVAIAPHLPPPLTTPTPAKRSTQVPATTHSRPRPTIALPGSADPPNPRSKAGKGPPALESAWASRISAAWGIYSVVTAGLSEAFDIDLSLLGWVTHELSAAISVAAQDIDHRFPDPRVTWNAEGLPALAASYEQALHSQQAPEGAYVAAIVWTALLSPDAERDAALAQVERRHASESGAERRWVHLQQSAEAYTDALWLHAAKHGEVHALQLTSMAQELSDRAELLVQTGEDLEQTVLQLGISGMCALEVTCAALLDLIPVANTLQALGAKLRGLAVRTAARAVAYRDMTLRVTKLLDTIPATVEQQGMRLKFKSGLH